MVQADSSNCTLKVSDMVVWIQTLFKVEKRTLKYCKCSLKHEMDYPFYRQTE